MGTSVQSASVRLSITRLDIDKAQNVTHVFILRTDLNSEADSLSRTRRYTADSVLQCLVLLLE